MPDPTHLLWLDLETTGTNEQTDQLIEAAVILTDLELTEVTRRSWLVPYDYTGALRLRDNAYVTDMHRTSGLLEHLADRYQDFTVDEGVPTNIRAQILQNAERELRQIVDSVPGSHTVMLAGSGVSHFDRRFLKTQMRNMETQLAYPSIDIGVARRMADMWGCGEWEPPAFNSGKTHRAMDDVVCHLDEARWWRSKLQGEEPY